MATTPTTINEHNIPMEDSQKESEKPYNSTSQIPNKGTEPLTNRSITGVKVVGKIDLSLINETTRPPKSKRSKLKKTPVLEKNNVQVPFSSLSLRNRRIYLNYMGKLYYKDFQKSNYYSSLISKYLNILPDTEREKIYGFQILVQLENKNGKCTFEFADFDLHDFVRELSVKMKPTTHSRLMSTPENNTIQPFLFSDKRDEILPDSKMCVLNISNIEFCDGFYMIWIIKDGQKDKTIAPLRIDDTYSHPCLHYVQKYLSDRFPKALYIVYSDKSVITLTQEYTLRTYIRVLHDKINIRGKWWEEVQNKIKPSFTQCLSVPPSESKKKISFRNGYLDSLSSLQNNQKLIPVYEINHGNKEDAFMFSIDMPGEKCAVIFENVSYASTATEIFITKRCDYEHCIERVFDYFTDFGINAKRESLRRGVNTPDKFKAEKHYAVNHYDLETWISTLFKILKQPLRSTKIEFAPGLNVPKNYFERSIPTEEIKTQNIHNKLMQQLYNKLCMEYGVSNVGTEIKVGTKRIDTVVKFAESYDIYEIKTETDSFACVTLALGQLCQYAYLFCRDKIGKMVIVGPAEATKEVEDYLLWFRETYALQVYYLFLPI